MEMLSRCLLAIGCVLLGTSLVLLLAIAIASAAAGRVGPLMPCRGATTTCPVWCDGEDGSCA